MKRNLVQQHIFKFFPRTNTNVELYSKSIIEYIENSIDGNELMLHHVYINDYLSFEQQAKILDELIDFFHLYYWLHAEGENKYNSGTIVNSIKDTLRNNAFLRNPSNQEIQEIQKNKHFLRIKKTVVSECFDKNQPIFPKIVFNLNTSTHNDYYNSALRELRELFSSNGWKRLRIGHEEFSKKESLLRRFKYTLVSEAKEISDSNVSYIALNKDSFKINDKIKCSIDSNSYLNNIRSILFFNNYAKKDFNHFHLNSLESLNKDYGTIFQQVFSISYISRKAKNTIWNLILKRDNIKNTITGNLKDNFQSHIVLSDQYLGSTWCDVDFLGEETNEFWNSFHEIAEIYGLYELTSIKFRNIISLCFSDFIKDYIINTVFNNLSNNLITIETKRLITELEDEVKEELNKELEFLLDYIKDSGNLMTINDKIHKYNRVPNIIISNSFANNDELREEIIKILKVPERKINTWESKSFNSSNVIVLAYRDIGNFKYHFYPNLFEYDGIDLKEAFLIKFLFHHNYNWACYSYNKELADLLENPVLIKNYKWKELKTEIRNTKPINLQLDFEKEAIYTNSENATEYKIKYKGRNKEVKIEPHERVIICNEDYYEILTAPVFFNNYDKLSDFEIVELDELITGLGLPEKDYNRPEITDQLALLKIDFEIDDLDSIENGGRLWKILLDRKRRKLNNDIELYNEIQNVLLEKSLHIVSQNTFFNVWCNPESNTIRTNLKALKEVCRYLGLPNSYFQLIRSFSSDTANIANQSTRIHNELLVNLIDLDGLKLHNEENKELLLAQLINNLSSDLKQDLKLIGFSEMDLSRKLEDVICQANKIIKVKKQIVEKLNIKEPR